MSRLSFLLAGGGTSGHIYPALAIAEQIQKDYPNARLAFCGTSGGLESKLIPAAGYPFHTISARGFPSRPSIDLIRAYRSYAKGRQECREIIKAMRPNAVIGTGGYVCGPVAAAAADRHVPLLLHEQNAYPGRANRLMARRSQCVCISFREAASWFKTKAPVVITGNPVRSIFFNQSYEQARNTLGWPVDQPVVLAMGGSLGARSINEAVLGLSSYLPDQGQADRSQVLRVHLGCGRQHADEVSGRAKTLPWLTVYDYIEQVHLLMAAADLVICRAGAGACFELAALGKPSILIPYPFAAGDHQTANARALVDAGAALLCRDSDLNSAWLWHQIQYLLKDKEKLSQMGLAALNQARPQAAADICRQLYSFMIQPE